MEIRVAYVVTFVEEYWILKIIVSWKEAYNIGRIRVYTVSGISCVAFI